MAYPLGSVQVTGNIGTTDVADTYATHLDSLGSGGLRAVADLTARDAITTDRRVFGMVAILQSDGSSYILSNLAMGGTDNDITNNDNWLPYGTGVGGNLWTLDTTLHPTDLSSGVSIGTTQSYGPSSLTFAWEGILAFENSSGSIISTAQYNVDSIFPVSGASLWLSNMGITTDFLDILYHGDSTFHNFFVSGNLYNNITYRLPNSDWVIGNVLGISDWDNTNKVATLDWVTPSGGLTSVSVSTPLTGNGTSGSPIALHAADASHDGYLSSSDWQSFDSRGFMNWESAWSSSSIYTIQNVVNYGGATYISKTAGNLNNQPDTHPTNWELITTAGSMVYPGAGIAVSTSSAWGTSLSAGTPLTNVYLKGAITTGNLSFSQIDYADISGTPSIPIVGTWGALNYPTWSSGTPFVKMTAAGTFALDSNTYLTSGSLTGYVPYTGATGDVDLATHGLFATTLKIYAVNGTNKSIFEGGTQTSNATYILPTDFNNIDNVSTWALTAKQPSTDYELHWTKIPSLNKTESILSSATITTTVGDTPTNTGLFVPVDTYTFTISAHTVYIGDQYTNNGQTFTVLEILGSTSILCTGTGSPTASGTLTFSSGTGSGNLTFSHSTTNNNRYIITKVIMYLTTVSGSITAGMSMSIGNNYPSTTNLMPATDFTSITADSIFEWIAPTQGMLVVNSNSGATSLIGSILTAPLGSAGAYLQYNYDVFGYQIN